LDKLCELASKQPMLHGARIIYEDDSCLPQRSVTAHSRLTSVENVKLFLGPCCTTAVAAVAPLLRKNNQIAINFCTGSEGVYDLSGGNIFHSQYSAQAEATFNAHQMWDLGIRRPILVLQESEFGHAHEAAFREAFPNKNVKTFSYSGPDREQMKSLIVKIREQDFDGIYVPLVETFLLGFMTEMNRAGLRGKKVFGIYSVQLPALIEAEGSNIEGVLYSYPDIPTTQNAAEYFATLATQMLEVETRKCGEATECIKKALFKDYNFNSHGFLTNQLLLKTIRNGTFMAYQGG
jgi:ABC-type branched-subunit amino acid transport system substrate-binding protein